MKNGIWYAFGAYILWGLFPIYWKLLDHVPALEVIGHRIIWSFAFLFVVVVASGQLCAFRSQLTGRNLGIYLIAGVLLSANWLIYVWGVNSDRVIETSLGYFINPLFSVLLGVIFLRENLRPWQWVPIGMAAAGVFYLAFAYGSLPWIALSLAFTFGMYGLLKKVAPLGSLYGLTLETGLVFLPALGYLLYISGLGQASLGSAIQGTSMLLIGAGLVTTIPLLMFASAAQRIPLTLVGIMQYIAPTLQFLIGVVVYREPFSIARLIGFSLIWIALLIFWTEGYFNYRKSAMASYSRD